MEQSSGSGSGPAASSHHDGYPQQRPLRQPQRRPLEPEDEAGPQSPGYAPDDPDPGDAPATATATATTADDAVLDLAELEQLQEEAERMKGLGNKHMAAQEYTRAYNAYSAALQLSPVGPSSHVFLSNRAAALLSLKRYAAAAVDARRAAALAPTFGKAHARLGQALYFLRQYAGAVAAYEDALRFEDDEAGGGGGNNGAVTRAYLRKAQEKLAKQEEKERRKRERREAVAAGGLAGAAAAGAAADADADADADESVNPTVAYSVATDKDRAGVASGRGTTSARVSAAVRPAAGDRGGAPDGALARLALDGSPTHMTVETGTMGGPAPPRRAGGDDPAAARGPPPPALPFPSPDVSAIAGDDDDDGDAAAAADDPDPDFDEALRLQRRATHFLARKQYRTAVDEFSAALFLVPDDPVLTPQLHVGRAHALNGQERHASAQNDALMALRQILRHAREGGEDPGGGTAAAEAYSVLGRSLYYARDYAGSAEALEESARLWEEGGLRPSVFDAAHLEECRAALAAGLGGGAARGEAGAPGGGGGGVPDDGASLGGGKSVASHAMSVVTCVKEGKSLSNIPKLKPPRFVSREKALQTVPSLPPMPKDWPQQSPTSPSSVAAGPERAVTFLSDAMGLKLNRGTDGLVRVVSVANLPPGSPILRRGEIRTGDLVREAAGVDLRRPITATMWGDTVALIKMAPRPVELVFAQELTSGFRRMGEI